MSTLTLTPKLQITQPPAAPIARQTIRRVLWRKFLEWLQDASLQAILKTGFRALLVLVTVWITSAPSFAFGILWEALQWRNYRIPLCIAAVTLVLNAKPLYRLARRRAAASRSENQHTYHGVPVGALASFLFEKGAFKIDDALGSLALSQGQYKKIGTELEDRGVLIRGEKNARVLREIEYEMLVKQLRDGFPYVYDEHGKAWVERRGSFDRWVLDREKRESNIEEAIEKKERKLDRIEKRVQEASAFETLFSKAA